MGPSHLFPVSCENSPTGRQRLAYFFFFLMGMAHAHMLLLWELRQGDYQKFKTIFFTVSTLPNQYLQV